MYKVLAPHVLEVVQALGLDPRVRVFGLMSELTGISRQALEQCCKNLQGTRGIGHDPVNGGGRKRTAAAAHLDLPDISQYLPEQTVRTPLPVLEPEAGNLVSLEDLMPVQDAMPAFEEEGFEADQENSEESLLFLGMKRVTPGHLREVQLAGRKREMQPLSVLSQKDREHVVGLRLTSLALRLETRALGGREFESTIDWLDIWFPEQLGQVHHSKRFMDEMLVSAKQTLKYRTAEDIQLRLPALGIPSFCKLVCDGFTPSTGEPLDIQMLQMCNDTGSVDLYLLDMPPAAAVPMADKTYVRQITENRLQTLHSLGVDRNQLRFRCLGLTGDGLLAGPFGGDHGLCLAEVLYENIRPPDAQPDDNQPLIALLDEADPVNKLPLPKDCWSALDSMHAADKSGGHADFEEEMVCNFHSVTRRIKLRYGFGKGLSVARSVAKRFRLTFHAPLAPASESTRLVAYESRRVPPNLFNNLRVIAGALAVSIQARLEQSRQASIRHGHNATETCGMYSHEVKALRQLGRDLLSPRMLLFVALRYDSRMQGSVS